MENGGWGVAGLERIMLEEEVEDEDAEEEEEERLMSRE